MKRRLLHIIFLIFFISNCLGQNPKDVFKTDTIAKNKNYQLIATPIVFYTPETNFGFGGGGQLFLLNSKNKYNDRISNIFFDAIFTSNKQIIVDLLPQIYFGEGDYYLDMQYKWAIYPNSFWGIGRNTANSDEESFNMTSHELKISFLKRLPPNLNFGFEYIFENHELTEVEENGLLDEGDIVGSDRSIISGLGVVFNFDSRDNVGSPISGHFLKMGARFSSEIFGSTQAYNKFIGDLRTYQRLSEQSIVAFQVYYESNYGDPPFQGLASFGGSTRARGYFYGRFIDKHMYVVQAEYRYRFRTRWALNGFGLFGEVANLPNDYFNLDNIKPSIGGGIRYKLLENQDTWIRADIGFGLDGSSGFYFGVNEAF
jgi:outer membrane translocation and assembly module TamA